VADIAKLLLDTDVQVERLHALLSSAHLQCREEEWCEEVQSVASNESDHKSFLEAPAGRDHMMDSPSGRCEPT